MIRRFTTRSFGRIASYEDSFSETNHVHPALYPSCFIHLKGTNCPHWRQFFRSFGRYTHRSFTKRIHTLDYRTGFDTETAFSLEASQNAPTELNQWHYRVPTLKTETLHSCSRNILMRNLRAFLPPSNYCLFVLLWSVQYSDCKACVSDSFERLTRHMQHLC